MRYLLYLTIFLLIVSQAEAHERLHLTVTKSAPILAVVPVLEEAYARIGMSPDITILPALRGLKDVNAGIYDGDIARMNGLTEDYPNLIQIPVPLSTIDGIAYTCREDIRIKNASDLKKYRVGIRRGIRFAELLVQDMPHIKMDSWNHLFDMLFRGRLDVVIAAREALNRQRQRPDSQCLIVNEPPLARLEIFHYLHKRNKDIVPRLTKILREMHTAGEIEKLRITP